VHEIPHARPATVFYRSNKSASTRVLMDQELAVDGPLAVTGWRRTSNCERSPVDRRWQL